MTTVLITAVGGGVGQAVIRALRLHTFKTRLVGTDADPSAAGLYSVDKAFVTLPLDHPDYIERMLTICAAEKVDLLIPGIDPEIMVFAKRKEDFARLGTQVMTGSPNSVELCRNKLKTYRFFKEHGMPFVKTETLADCLAHRRDLDYPLILKPVDGSASRGVAVVLSPQEMERFRDQADRMIVQDYLVPASWGIPTETIRYADLFRGGLLRQEDELGGSTLLSREGEILGTYLCSFELKNGVLVGSQLLHDEEIIATMEEMASLLAKEGMIGSVSFQGRITRAGTVFYEMNPRFTGGNGASAGMGFNACGAIVDSFVRDLPSAEIRRDLRKRHKARCIRYVTEMIVEEEDYQRLLREGTLANGKGKTLVLEG